MCSPAPGSALDLFPTAHRAAAAASNRASLLGRGQRRGCASHLIGDGPHVLHWPLLHAVDRLECRCWPGPLLGCEHPLVDRSTVPDQRLGWPVSRSPTSRAVGKRTPGSARGTPRRSAWKRSIPPSARPCLPCWSLVKAQQNRACVLTSRAVPSSVEGQTNQPPQELRRGLDQLLVQTLCPHGTRLKRRVLCPRPAGAQRMGRQVLLDRGSGGQRGRRGFTNSALKSRGNCWKTSRSSAHSSCAIPQKWTNCLSSWRQAIPGLSFFVVSAATPFLASAHSGVRWSTWQQAAARAAF